MRILAEILLAAALFAAMTALWRVYGRVCFTPVPRTDGATIFTVIAVSGSGAGLEQTVGSLIWLAGAASLSGRIIIADRGLDDKGAHIASLLERDHKNVAVCPAPELINQLEDVPWREKS